MLVASACLSRSAFVACGAEEAAAAAERAAAVEEEMLMGGCAGTAAV